MSEVDLRIQKTERDIQHALIECLHKEPFSKITINDLCQTAMVGRSTFYNHYVDKYALLDDMVAKQLVAFNTLLKARMETLMDDDLLTYLYHELSQNKDTILILLETKTATADLAAGMIDSLKQATLPILKAQSFKVPVDFLVELYATGAFTAIHWALRHGSEQEIAQFMNHIVAALINIS